MKQIIFIMTVLLISSAARADKIFLNPVNEKNTGDYSLEIYPDAITNVSLVKFYIRENSFVKINVTNEFNDNSETLAEGEIEKGEHCLYFKAAHLSPGRKFVCKMEVMDTEKVNIIFLKEIIFQIKALK